MTKILKADQVSEAALIIRNGGTVCFPTETVYGIGVNALDVEAVKKVYEAKGRPSDNPTIVHVGDRLDVDALVVEVPLQAEELMERFWPGPLTIIFKNKEVPSEVLGGLDTVGIRIPDNEIALSLLKESGLPIAAPSANISGKPSPTTFAHVKEDMFGKVDAIIDGGDCKVGVESTVIDMTGKIPIVLRPGGVTVEQLKEVLDDVVVASQELDKPKSPGMKYTHYTPEAEVILVEGKCDKVKENIIEILKKRKLE